MKLLLEGSKTDTSHIVKYKRPDFIQWTCNHLFLKVEYPVSKVGFIILEKLIHEPGPVPDFLIYHGVGHNAYCIDNSLIP